MRGGRIGKLARTGASLPANPTQFLGRRHAKPLPILPHVIAQPLQGLSLGTGDGSFTEERGDHLHVRTQMRQHGDVPLLPAPAFAFGRQIAHVGDDLARPPRPTLITVMDAGHQQSPLGNIGGSHPTDQRHQQDRLPAGPPPQTEAVLLVADETAALAGLERAPAQGRVGRRVSGRVFFLKLLQAAGRSVASMRAVAFSHRAAVWINGWSSTSLICRNPWTPTRARNALRRRTSGPSWRWRSRTKERQAGCSRSKLPSKLSE